MEKNARSVARIRNGNITLSYGRKAFFKCFRRIHKCIRWLKAGGETFVLFPIAHTFHVIVLFIVKFWRLNILLCLKVLNFKHWNFELIFVSGEGSFIEKLRSIVNRDPKYVQIFNFCYKRRFFLMSLKVREFFLILYLLCSDKEKVTFEEFER